MQALEREIITPNWITILFVVALALLTLLSSIDGKKLKKSLFAIFDPIFIEEEVEENPSFFGAFNLVIYLFFTLIMGLLFYQINADFSSKNTHSLTYLNCFLMVFIYFSLKWFLEYLLKILFQLKEQITYFQLFKNRSLYTLSLVLFVVLLLTIYSGFSIFFLISTTLVLFGVRFFSVVINNKKLILSKLFYFILYLCALEIAPLFIIFKLTF